MPYSRHVGYLCPGITLSRRVITGRHAALRFTPLPKHLSLSLSPLLLLTSSNILSISASKSPSLSKLPNSQYCCFARSISRNWLKMVENRRGGIKMEEEEEGRPQIPITSSSVRTRNTGESFRPLEHVINARAVGNK